MLIGTGPRRMPRVVGPQQHRGFGQAPAGQHPVDGHLRADRHPHPLEPPPTRQPVSSRPLTKLRRAAPRRAWYVGSDLPGQPRQRPIEARTAHRKAKTQLQHFGHVARRQPHLLRASSMVSFPAGVLPPSSGFQVGRTGRRLRQAQHAPAGPSQAAWVFERL
jgi:hypothetical protein